MNQIKHRFGKTAFTIVELLVILAVLAIAACLLLPALAGTNHRALRVQCSANLKQVSLAFHVWANDNGGLTYQAAVTNGSFGLLSPGSGWPIPENDLSSSPQCPNTYLAFGVMSNELNTPKVVVCPADDRRARTNFSSDFGSVDLTTGGKNTSVSYFAGRDATPNFPQMFLAGDRDICADTTLTAIPNNGYGLSPDPTPASPSQGATVGFGNNPGILNGVFHVGWSPVRMHQGFGNVALMDGSVQQFNSSGLVQGLVQSGDTYATFGAPNVLLFP